MHVIINIKIRLKVILFFFQRIFLLCLLIQKFISVNSIPQLNGAWNNLIAQCDEEDNWEKLRNQGKLTINLQLIHLFSSANPRVQILCGCSHTFFSWTGGHRVHACFSKTAIKSTGDPMSITAQTHRHSPALRARQAKRVELPIEFYRSTIAREFQVRSRQVQWTWTRRLYNKFHIYVVSRWKRNGRLPCNDRPMAAGTGPGAAARGEAISFQRKRGSDDSFAPEVTFF